MSYGYIGQVLEVIAHRSPTVLQMAVRWGACAMKIHIFD